MHSLVSNDNFINSYAAEIPNINCHGGVPLLESDDPNHYTRSPPVSLIQPYFRCQYTTYQVCVVRLWGSRGAACAYDCHARTHMQVWTNSLSNAWSTATASQEVFIAVLVFIAAR
jgi:hypothetical protein